MMYEGSSTFSACEHSGFFASVSTAPVLVGEEDAS